MKAHDFIQPRNRLITSKGLWFGGFLGLFKILKCLGICIINDLLKSLHVVQLLFLLKLGASIFLLPFQKPFSSGKKLTKNQWNRVTQHALLCSLAQTFWFYGITLCGPIRAILVFEHSSLVVLSALNAVIFGSGGPAKLRGAILMGLGFVSLIILDRDVTVPHEHNEKHSHHGGLNHLFYHVVNWFGVADHKGGVVLLVVALLINVCTESVGRKLAADIGGMKRLFALSTFVSTILLTPFALFTFITQQYNVNSWFNLFLTCEFVVLLVFVADFYAETICVSRLDSSTVARYCPILMFVSAFLFGFFWFEPYRTASPVDLLHGHGLETVEHGFSGGLIFTLIFFILATLVLTYENAPKAKTGQFVGYSASGMPLYVYGEDFLQKTSQSVVTFVKNTLKQILVNQDSRRIFYFLCLNLFFTFVEFVYGILTNSLGLISDAFHMLFDCSALVMGLVAAVMSTWPGTRQFSYGYGRIEILSGFINGLFLVVIACFIFFEAVERLFEPPEIRTEKLLFVSIAGLCVNLFGIFVFHGAHGHSHGGGGGGGHEHSHSDHSHSSAHGHSHSSLPTTQSHSHSHSHGHSHNANMQGVFLHILADTFGSVGVIISSLLIQYFGWLIADPICSSLLAVLIFLSVLPLLRQSTSALLLRPSEDIEINFKEALDQILRLDGVLSYSTPHLWQLKSDSHVGTLHVQITNDKDQQKITQQVGNILRCAGISQPVVQVEKENFLQTVYALCPSYEVPARVSRKPFNESLLVKSI